MKKTFNIDFSGDTLLGAADSLLEEDRFIEALRILNRNAALNGNDEVSYFLYAEIYDELGLYDKAIHNLYKSLDYNNREDPGECYKGLAICYMNIGDKKMSTYYYSMFLDTPDAEMDETMEDVQDYISESSKKSPLKFVYPPEIADFSEVFDKGVTQAMNDQTKDAIKTFEKIPEGNSLYFSARMNIATCHMLEGNLKAAEDECTRILEKDPDSLLALINMANVRLEQKRYDQAREIAEKLLTFETDNLEEKYKMATIYCETGLDKEAYECFTSMVYDLGSYNFNVLFFRAVAAFNAQMGEEALDAVNLMLDVYPVSISALYAKTLMYSAVKKNKYWRMEYSYGLPDDMAVEYMTLLATFRDISKTRAREVYKDTDILDVILWCFDGEFLDDKSTFQETALSVAVKIGEYDIVRDYLLERRLANNIKMKALIQLSERNVDETYGIVISDILIRVHFKKLAIGRRGRTPFLRAYGTLVARFSFLNGALGEIIAPVAEKIYAKMDALGVLNIATDEHTLPAAMYKMAGLGFDKLDEDTMYAILGTRKRDVDELIKLLGEV